MVVTIDGMVRCVVTLEVKVAAGIDGEIVVIASVVVKDAEIVNKLLINIIPHLTCINGCDHWWNGKVCSHT